jgi:two-component system, chemotaxis family, protein-glutamate methylesterase/glutaminase
MPTPKLKRNIKAVVIGASAGGVDALLKTLPGLTLPSSLAVMLVLHISPDAASLLPAIFADRCSFQVKEAEMGEPITQQVVYVAAPDYHLSVEADHTLSLSSEDKVNYSRPSIDLLFESAARVYREGLMGILLTGANHDGAAGMKCIHQLGGVTIVQDPVEASHPQMPQAALDMFLPDMVLKTQEIKELLASVSSSGVFI